MQSVLMVILRAKNNLIDQCPAFNFTRVTQTSFRLILVDLKELRLLRPLVFELITNLVPSF